MKQFTLIALALCMMTACAQKPKEQVNNDPVVYMTTDISPEET